MEPMTGRKVAVVTGAGSGIGRAVAGAFSARGYAVVLIGRTTKTLAETASIIGAKDILIAPCDVRDQTEVNASFELARQTCGRIDVLFNSAGLFGDSAAFDAVAADDWRQVIDVNLTGSFLSAQAAFRQMKRQSPPGGRIINCGSISAYSPRPMAAAYTASKHAVTGLTRQIALEGRPWRIACGQLDIGNAATTMTERFSSGTLQADMSMRNEPLFDVSHVAAAALFMADLPLDANVLTMTVMATAMPFVGRG